MHDTGTANVTVARVQGHHWLLDLAGCNCDPALMADALLLRAFCLDACSAVGMQVVGDVFHQFAPAGVTGVVLLAESHLSVHTWPELHFAAVDVYVCDFNHANAARGEALVCAVQAGLLPTSAHVRDHARHSVRQAPARV